MVPYNPDTAVFFSQNPAPLPVAITFDCSWNDAYTETLLDLLDTYSAHATFFVSSGWAKRYPQRVKELAERGHEVGSHSDSHRALPSLSLDEKAQELLNGKKEIEACTGAAVQWFRPPYGSIDAETLRLCRASGMYCVLWDIDSLDWKNIPTSQICRNILQECRPGDILLFQNGALNTASALEHTLEALQRQGYSFYTMSQLMSSH